MRPPISGSEGPIAGSCPRLSKWGDGVAVRIRGFFDATKLYILAMVEQTSAFTLV